MPKISLLQIMILLLLSSFFCSCGKGREQRPYPASLLLIDSLANNEVKKAVPYLEQLKDSLSFFDEEQRVYYDLLSLKVKDKMYIEHTSDSVIKRITAFYEEYGDRDKLLECYYYMGRVYLDLQDAPEALKYFQKAIDIAGDTKKYMLLSGIYSQIGALFFYQNIYEEAIPIHEKAYHYMKLAKNEITYSMPIRDIARVYDEMGKKDSAIIQYNKAYDMAIKTGNRERALGILTELSAVYRSMGKYEEAWKYLKISLSDTLDRYSIPTYWSMGQLSLRMNQLDSTEHYMKKCLHNSTNLYILSGAYDCLSKVEESRSNYKEAIKYARLYQQYEDSIQKITVSEEIRKMRSLYNYQLREKENQRLMQENAKNRTLFYQVVTGCLCLLLLAFFILYRTKKRKDRIEEQAKKLQAEKELQYKESIAYVAENNQRLATLEASLTHEKEEKDTLLSELVQVQRELLSVTNRKIELRHTERDLLEANLKRSDIYMKFRLACRDSSLKITETDWTNLGTELDIVYNGITTRLYGLYPQLSQLELRICYLIKISVKVSDMALFLNRSKSTISSARNRLYTKLTGKEGRPEELDLLILDF